MNTNNMTNNNNKFEVGLGIFRLKCCWVCSKTAKVSVIAANK